MCDSKRVLNRGCGPLTATILVIGEAPGRLGADSSELPFHGDKAGHNFESLIALVGLSRNDLFITNAALCNPRDAEGRNSTPTDTEVSACASFLKRQIDLIAPNFVVTLGAVALRAVSFIEPHRLSLKTAVRSSTTWYGRELIPLYHPGQRAMIHRSFANQSADYQFLAEKVRRHGKLRASKIRPAPNDIANVAAAILTRFGTLSYFSLHKISYLVEYLYKKKWGVRLTRAYYVRQKDGPYCVDLHPQRLNRAGVGIEIVTNRNGMFVRSSHSGLFDEALPIEPADELSQVIDDVFQRYSQLSDARLKTAVYLTAPMRDILRMERQGSNQFNAPISFV